MHVGDPVGLIPGHHRLATEWMVENALRTPGEAEIILSARPVPGLMVGIAQPDHVIPLSPIPLLCADELQQGFIVLPIRSVQGGDVSFPGIAAL